MKQVFPSFLVAVLLLVAFLAGCRLDYGSTVEADDLAQDVPDVRTTSTVFEVYRDGKLALSLKVGNAAFFSKSGRRDFDDVEFTQYDSKGEAMAQGTAQKAVYDIQGEKTEFTGALDVNLVQENTRIKTEYLVWDKKEGFMRGKPQIQVEVSKDDGTFMTGYDILVDVNQRYLSLKGGVSGVVFSSDE